jgi:2-polyprenyl-3-methyl-5-hydroxy-6-metoxy-1,4-benzoquinol methylase
MLLTVIRWIFVPQEWRFRFMGCKKDNNLEEYFNERAKEFSERYLKRQEFEERYRVFERNIDGVFNRVSATGCLGLDIGCGNGILSRIAATRGCQIIGIDQSIFMINLAKEEAKKENLSNLTHYIHSKFPCDLENFYGKFSLVIASSVLEYMDDVPIALIKINQVLKGNGFLLVSIPNYWSLYWCFYRLVQRPFGIRIFNENSRLCLAMFGEGIRYQKHRFSAAEFRNIAKECGFKYIRHEYFGATKFIYKLFPRYRNLLLGSLFLMILQKSTEVSE